MPVSFYSGVMPIAARVGVLPYNFQGFGNACYFHLVWVVRDAGTWVHRLAGQDGRVDIKAWYSLSET